MENHELEMAQKFLQETNYNIFLTGKAGTGKTTFLLNIQKQIGKRLVVTAPTGVAAINAGGVTLHSFFQRPFGPWLPGTPEVHNMRKEKVKVLRNIDLLIIDEISMVRADLLDSIDSVLRRYRHNESPFGGVQLLMIGDLYQLPPVVKDDEWDLLHEHYKTPFFFSSHALQKAKLIPIELKTVYRQSDSEFITLLNKVRENNMDDDALRLLNSRYGTELDEDDGIITLCSHNAKADAINSERLAQLKGSERIYSAEVEGEFPESSWPTPESLTLKTGAQVMFVRNDQGEEKRFYNGKLGTVLWVGKDEVGVRCPDDEEIVVKAICWENIEYNLDEEEMELKQKTIGSFSQIPLKLAWAITIHKSQGLTFDQVIIDAGSSFAHGQTYVALSRCRSFQGMSLTSEITRRAIHTDSDVQGFSRWSAEHEPTEEELQQARISYQQKLLFSCFNFDNLQQALWRFISLLRGNISRISFGGGDIETIETLCEEQIGAVGKKFCNQLAALFKKGTLPAEDEEIIERLDKASVWFQERFDELLLPFARNFFVEIDNSEMRKQFDRRFLSLRREIFIQYAAIASCANCGERFSANRYFKKIGAAEIEAERRKKCTERSSGISESSAGSERESSRAASKKEAGAVKIYGEEEITHPDFFAALKEWRLEKSRDEDIAAYLVLAQKPLIQIAILLPTSKKELLAVHGIGPKLYERYGEEILAMVKEYRLENGITEISLPEVGR